MCNSMKIPGVHSPSWSRANWGVSLMRRESDSKGVTFWLDETRRVSVFSTHTYTRRHFSPVWFNERRWWARTAPSSSSLYLRPDNSSLWSMARGPEFFSHLQRFIVWNQVPLCPFLYSIYQIYFNQPTDEWAMYTYIHRERESLMFLIPFWFSPFGWMGREKKKIVVYIYIYSPYEGICESTLWLTGYYLSRGAPIVYGMGCEHVIRPVCV